VAFDRIVVVGGGTAGWMAAAACASHLPHSSVEVIDFENVDIVGVGEASVPSIRDFHRTLGIDEIEFLRQTNGTYTLGIEFQHWKEPGTRYFHTFGDFGDLGGPLAPWEQYRRLGDSSLDMLGRLCLPTVMALHGRFCVPRADGSDGPTCDYAYHFDAALYAGLLRDIALSRGARRTEGCIAAVERRDDGAIGSVTLADGRQVTGDLFIDCSGFRSLLLGEALGEPFVDFSRWLPLDRAWSCPGERVGTPIQPYSRATALEAGWAWRIPLQSRTGHGHVFASRYLDEDEARDQLRWQLDGEALAEPTLHQFTPGHRRRAWVRNVVALGPASGFIEALESTGLLLMQSGLGRLVDLLASGGPVDDDAVARYNAATARQFAHLRDFTLLHYCLNARQDSTFWHAMASMELPATLALRIDTWRELGTLHLDDDEPFDAASWLAIHAGMEHWPQRMDAALETADREEALRILQRRRTRIAATVGGLPPHHAYIAQVLRGRRSRP
jgi:tryptophan halogenase